MKSALFIEKKFKEYIIYISLARASARVDGLVVVILIDLHFSSANVLDIPACSADPVSADFG